MRLRLARLVGVGLLPLALALVTATGQEPAAPVKAPAKAPEDFRETDASEFVGVDTCKSCHEHEAASQSYDHGPHWKTERDTRGVSWQGCEACHGPGKVHVDSPGNKGQILRFPTLTAEQASRICVDCHQTAEDNTSFSRSAHQSSGVGCTACHSEHKPKTKLRQLTAKEPELCYDCHLESRLEFSKPFHDPVNEGMLQCSDCHNSHGGFQSKLLRSTAAQDQVCFKCHAEKSGPFVFEHAPMRIEGCGSCHAPIHGSSNPRLLTRANVNLLCLECHTMTPLGGATPTFHNQAQKYQSCTLCHTQQHGSNVDKNFLR